MTHGGPHQEPATARLRVGKTRKYGKGVFAEEDIRAGRTVAILSGERISLSQLVERICKADERMDDPLQIGPKTYIDLDSFSRSFNHSCTPTCGVRRTSELFALRNIARGEELTYDYSSTVAPTDWSMNCKCGSAKCRKDIGPVLTLPRETLDQYKYAGALQDYMTRLLKKIDLNGGRYDIPRYELKALARVHAMKQSQKGNRSSPNKRLHFTSLRAENEA